MTKKGTLELIGLSILSSLVLRILVGENGLQYKYTYIDFSLASRLFLPMQAWFWSTLTLLFFQSVIHMKNAVHIRRQKRYYPMLLVQLAIYYAIVYTSMLVSDLLILGGWSWKPFLIAAVLSLFLLLWDVLNLRGNWSFLAMFFISWLVLRL